MFMVKLASKILSARRYSNISNILCVFFSTEGLAKLTNYMIFKRDKL